MPINDQEYDVRKKASQGARFVSVASASILGVNLNLEIRNEKIMKISDQIRDWLKEKKTITIPEIMKKFGINAADAIEAIEILREEGHIQEIDSAF